MDAREYHRAIGEEKAMGEAPLGTPSSDRPLENRLDSWKEIAAYLKRDVTTVQRWEKREGMPVHRHLHDRMGSVYASRVELDAWTRTRNSAAPVSGNGALSPISSIAARAAQPASTPNTRAGLWRNAFLLLAPLVVVVLGALVWLRNIEYFWKSPLAGAQFKPLTDFDGVSGAAAVSRDGNLVAFLSDRDGPTDVWITQVGSGEYHNLTRGTFQGLANPSVRTLGFPPDGSLVSFWVRRPDSSGKETTSTWAVPTLGGQPRPYFDGVVEFDWSRDGSQLAFHTSASGDPLYISKTGRISDSRPIFTAAPGLHSHFPLWSRDSAFLYFVGGSLPDKLDVWRISSAGGAPERITYQNTSMMYPVLLTDRTLLYLATDADGSGPWLYSLDVERRVVHRLTSGPERYTSLAASADGRHLATTIASTKRSLWQLSMAAPAAAEPTPIPLNTGTGFSPRLGPNYLLYISTAGAGEGIWKFAEGKGTQLWHASGAHIIGAPAISSDGSSIAFSVRESGRSLLNIMQSDGTNLRVVCDSLDLDGTPAWSPDGLFITTAAKDHGTPHLVQVAVDGRSPAILVSGYSLDPAWSPDSRLVLYSGPDIGTTFTVKALTTKAPAAPLSSLTLTRGARHLTFLQDGRTVVFLQGDIQHKDLWQMDLQTGVERPLTRFPPGFNISDFDLSPDGREIVLERAEERSEVMLLDLPSP